MRGNRRSLDPATPQPLCSHLMELRVSPVHLQLREADVLRCGHGPVAARRSSTRGSQAAPPIIRPTGIEVCVLGTCSDELHLQRGTPRQ